MTTVRCPSCDAALPGDATWCSLCFARVSGSAAETLDPWVAAEVAEAPATQPVAPVDPFDAAPLSQVFPPAPTPTPPPVTPAPVMPAPVAPPLVARPPVAPAAVAPAAAAPVAVATAPVATMHAPTWPCTACDTSVAFDLSACPNCGTAFMGGTNPDVSLKVPGVGDLVHMSPGAKFGVMAGGAAAFSLLLVLLFLVLGHIF